MSPQKRKKLSQEIADHLAEKIINRQIRPGARITEAMILEEWDASSSPVREALYILERYHLVDLVPRKGARVKNFTIQDIQGLFEVMTELICLIVRLCCKNRTEEEMEAIAALGEKSRKRALEKDLDGYNETSLQFALLMLETTRNHVLAQTCMEWLPSVRRAYYLSLSQDNFNLLDSAAFLKEMQECAARRDSENGELIARNYTRREFKRIVKIAMESFSMEQ